MVASEPSAADQLFDAQSTRFAQLDPWLPPTPLLPGGDPLVVTLHDGGQVAGILSHTRSGPDSPRRLWTTTEVYELFPLLGDNDGAGMDPLLDSCRQRLRELDLGDTDSSVLVTWPSRDVNASEALLAHGMVPLSCLAIRPPNRPQPIDAPPGVTIRRATVSDLDVILWLVMAELRYSAKVGASILRPDAEAIKRHAVDRHLRAGDPVWLAERDGTAVGVAECTWADTAALGAMSRLQPGQWGCVNCLSVAPGYRELGVGGALMAVAHDYLCRHDAYGTYLYYNPPNPLSSVFWPRQGYRPLWTIWEVRPASAIR